ncbi:hypothetical protein Y1Q_0007584 [Alligator mississippiensis]|uniref:Uncharacterized protein n=1 Tax=Alligator mississippiensis TaxID=8496 RepID=A0A151NGG7_ALLMI|nr:hypothetical protein Y1Q_0007584 [Alligator mississippiensis]
MLARTARLPSPLSSDSARLPGLLFENQAIRLLQMDYSQGWIQRGCTGTAACLFWIALHNGSLWGLFKVPKAGLDGDKSSYTIIAI